MNEHHNPSTGVFRHLPCQLAACNRTRFLSYIWQLPVEVHMPDPGCHPCVYNNKQITDLSMVFSIFFSWAGELKSIDFAGLELKFKFVKLPSLRVICWKLTRYTSTKLQNFTDIICLMHLTNVCKLLQLHFLELYLS